MKDRESLLPKDCFYKGDLDMKRADILLDNNDPQGAAFHLQQALEKYLKGSSAGNGSLKGYTI